MNGIYIYREDVLDDGNTTLPVPLQVAVLWSADVQSQKSSI